MKKEVMEQWVEALRSGKYKQGKEYLKAGDRYCCLGVLCDISGIGEWEHSIAAIKSVQQYSCPNAWSGTILPHDVCEWAGMRTEIGILLYNSLVTLNDDKGASFEEIASVIENNWKEL